MNKSQQDVADDAHISVSAVRYNEMGLYVNPLPRLVRYFSTHFDAGAMVRNYFRFQVRTRQENARMWLMPPVDLRKEPVRTFLEYNNINVTRFCKQYCCQSVLLYKPKKILKTDLEKIFIGSGVTPSQLQELHDRLEEYHEQFRHNDGQRSTDRIPDRAEVL